jgi:hypothetical protein
MDPRIGLPGASAAGRIEENAVSSDLLVNPVAHRIPLRASAVCAIPMPQSADAGIDRCRDRSMQGSIDAGIDRCRDRSMQGSIDAGIDRCRDRSMQGSIDARIDRCKGSINARINRCRGSVDANVRRCPVLA